ncbi:MAG: hypothetical protein HQ488_02335 [Parcubacteria group bacterium]|nr:hypothetical protein [Parcubacteria group bacterium]
MVQYTMTLATNDGGASLVLMETPRQDVLHIWGKALDPDLDQRSQIEGLLRKAIADLTKTLLDSFGIQLKRIELRQGHVPLWNITGHLTKEAVEARGGKYIHTHPGGSIHEREAEHEMTRFTEVVIMCEKKLR